MTVDQTMVDRFAELTGDYQWVHVDVERAAREIGGTIAHGYFTLALIPRLFATLLRIAGVGRALNYGADRIRFLAPLRTGEPIEARLRIAELSDRGNGKLLRVETTVARVAGGPPVCVAETLLLLYPGEGVLE